MKTIFLITTLGLLYSCTNPETTKSTVPYGSSLQWEAIRKDIKSQQASLSFEDKLELCLLDFSFESAKDYNDMLEHPPDDVKATLLKNDVFIKICEKRHIDPNDIPNDYFSPYK
jgi:hypothetical protein